MQGPPNQPPTIVKIDGGSAADRAQPHLAVGMRVVAVNGKRMRGSTKIAKAIRNSDDHVHIEAELLMQQSPSIAVGVDDNDVQQGEASNPQVVRGGEMTDASSSASSAFATVDLSIASAPSLSLRQPAHQLNAQPSTDGSSVVPRGILPESFEWGRQRRWSRNVVRFSFLRSSSHKASAALREAALRRNLRLERKARGELFEDAVAPDSSHSEFLLPSTITQRRPVRWQRVAKRARVRRLAASPSSAPRTGLSKWPLPSARFDEDAEELAVAPSKTQLSRAARRSLSRAVRTAMQEGGGRGDNIHGGAGAIFGDDDGDEDGDEGGGSHGWTLEAWVASLEPHHVLSRVLSRVLRSRVLEQEEVLGDTLAGKKAGSGFEYSLVHALGRLPEAEAGRVFLSLCSHADVVGELAELLLHGARVVACAPRRQSPMEPVRNLPGEMVKDTMTVEGQAAEPEAMPAITQAAPIEPVSEPKAAPAATDVVPTAPLKALFVDDALALSEVDGTVVEVPEPRRAHHKEPTTGEAEATVSESSVAAKAVVSTATAEDTAAGAATSGAAMAGVGSPAAKEEVAGGAEAATTEEAEAMTEAEAEAVAAASAAADEVERLHQEQLAALDDELEALRRALSEAGQPQGETEGKPAGEATGNAVGESVGESIGMAPSMTPTTGPSMASSISARERARLRARARQVEEEKERVEKEKGRVARESAVAAEEARRRRRDATRLRRELERERVAREKLSDELFASQQALYTANLEAASFATAHGVPVMLDRYVENSPAGFDLQYGSMDDFRRGLAGLLVMAAPADPSELLRAMIAEHTAAADADTAFEVRNYGTVTSSRIEFFFVTDPSPNRLDRLRLREWPQEPKLIAAGRDGRRPLPIRSFRAARRTVDAQLRTGGEAPLSVEEFVAARLYTGPLYIKSARHTACTPGHPCCPRCTCTCVAPPMPALSSPLAHAPSGSPHAPGTMVRCAAYTQSHRHSFARRGRG